MNTGYKVTLRTQTDTEEITSLRSALVSKDQEISALHDRIEYLQEENARLTKQIQFNAILSTGETLQGVFE